MPAPPIEQNGVEAALDAATGKIGYNALPATMPRWYRWCINRRTLPFPQFQPAMLYSAAIGTTDFKGLSLRFEKRFAGSGFPFTLSGTNVCQCGSFVPRVNYAPGLGRRPRRARQSNGQTVYDRTAASSRCAGRRYTFPTAAPGRA